MCLKPLKTVCVSCVSSLKMPVFVFMIVLRLGNKLTLCSSSSVWFLQVPRFYKLVGINNSRLISKNISKHAQLRSKPS